jgi:hypothetical protein
MVRLKLDRAGKSNSIVLWQLANAAMGKHRPPLPSSLKVDKPPAQSGAADLAKIAPGSFNTKGDKEAAEAMNDFYVDKIDVLRSKLAGYPPPPPSDWPVKSKDFDLSFASAGKISKIIKGLGSTEALGVDGIPISVLK